MENDPMEKAIEEAIAAAGIEVPLAGTITDQALEDRNAAIRAEDRDIRKSGIINGRRVSLVLMRGFVKPNPKQVSVRSDDVHAAKKLATAMGLGLEPVFHSGHGYENRPHFHLNGTYYLRFDDAPDFLYNYHFKWRCMMDNDYFDFIKNKKN